MGTVILHTQREASRLARTNRCRGASLPHSPLLFHPHESPHGRIKKPAHQYGTRRTKAINYRYTTLTPGRLPSPSPMDRTPSAAPGTGSTGADCTAGATSSPAYLSLIRIIRADSPEIA